MHQGSTRVVREVAVAWWAVTLRLNSRLAMGRRPGRLWKGHSSCRVLSSSCSSDGRWMRSGCHRRDMVLQKGDIGSDILGFSMTAFEVFLDEYYKASGQTSASMGPADD